MERKPPRGKREFEEFFRAQAAEGCRRGKDSKSLRGRTLSAGNHCKKKTAIWGIGSYLYFFKID